MTLLVLVGCSPNQFVRTRDIPLSGLNQPLNLASKDGPQLTPRTTQVLRRHDLAQYIEEEPEKLIGRMQRNVAAEPTAENIYTFAELCYIEGKKAELDGKIDEALNLYGVVVTHAYSYLLDDRFNQQRNPYDPQFRLACDLYNGALENTLRIMNQRGQLKPGGSFDIDTDRQRYQVTVVARGKWQPQDLDRFEFVSDYRVTGLSNHYHTYGLGVPLIAVRKPDSGDGPFEQYYPPGITFPVTALFRVLPDSSSGETARQCVLELYDPLVSPDLSIAGRLIPLETDLSTPLAYFLNHPEWDGDKLSNDGLLDVVGTQELQGLYMVEPFDPAKIPVLMVHGFWSSPVTWMEMFNDLRNSPEIRDHYQFWFYMFPTGEPFWITAAQLRRELAELRSKLDPQRRAPALDQMVLVGHSMGGLVAKLQTLDSGQDYWNMLSEQPFEQLQAVPEVRQRLADVLFFEPNPSVRRVVSIATPHRGSQFSNGATRWLGRKLIALPQALVQSRQQLSRDNPGFFKDTELLEITTSVDALAPESPILPVIIGSQQAPWVKYHNIVGLVPEEGILGSIASGSDGVVKLASAQLTDANSEVVVTANHSKVHQHPRATLEVQRILLEHLNELRGRR